MLALLLSVVPLSIEAYNEKMFEAIREGGPRLVDAYSFGVSFEVADANYRASLRHIGAMKATADSCGVEVRREWFGEMQRRKLIWWCLRDALDESRSYRDRMSDLDLVRNQLGAEFYSLRVLPMPFPSYRE